MTYNYYYKGVNISNLTQSGGSLVVPGFTGFPPQQQQTPQQNYSSTVTNPFPLSYANVNLSTDIPADVAVNYCTAYTMSLNTTGPTIKMPLINGITYKHISAYGWGGGGGGGGGGGAFTGSPFHTGGYGGNGAAGAYAGTVQATLPLPTTTTTNAINYTVGTGGTYGKAGGKNPNAPSGKGTPGSPGNSTTVLFITTNNITPVKTTPVTILTAPGGDGGQGGQGGNVPSNGSPGDSGSTPTSTVNSGNIQYPPIIGAPVLDWPAQNSGNAGSGGNGSKSNSNSANRGNAGTPGYLQIYFLYE